MHALKIFFSLTRAGVEESVSKDGEVMDQLFRAYISVFITINKWAEQMLAGFPLDSGGALLQ